MIQSTTQLVDAINAGQESFCSFRKVPSQASTAGQWVDLSMAAGNPVPNYYASTPLVADTLDGMKGIYHGGDKSPSEMYLYEAGLCTPTAGLLGFYHLLDYLLYYPFVDGDATTVQTMDNSVSLPRYTTGDGVMAMMVALAPTTGNGFFTFTYVNQNGVSKTSPIQFAGTASTPIASLINAQPATVAGPGPFLKLAEGDTGIRSVTDWTWTTGNGGLHAIVLVKPLATLTVREASVVCEKQFIGGKMPLPRIYDGAYLNLIMNCAATVAAGTLSGHAKFFWR